MLVQCYAVKLHEGWTWDFSLDVRVDVQYRSECHRADLGMVMLEPSLPYGQALRLCEQLRANSRFIRPVPRTTISAPNEVTEVVSTEELKILQAQLKAALTACQISAGAQKWRLVRVDEAESRQQLSMHEYEYRMFVHALAGRALLETEVQSLVDSVCSKLGQDVHLSERWKSYIQLAALRGDVVLEKGMEEFEHRERPLIWKKVRNYTCKRCGSSKDRIHRTSCVDCGGACAYCQACLTMGRVRSCSMLIRGVGMGQREIAGVVDEGGGVREESREWDRTEGASRTLSAVGASPTEVELQGFTAPWGLSPAQSAAATAGLGWLSGNLLSVHENGMQLDRNNVSRSNFLIWAVTGAGKTEMIFPFVAYTLTQGGKVLIATPRRDVVLELAPRIARAFPDQAVVVLYGSSDQRWDTGPITIATTHQLIRFREAFDLVIIDELDAFPYHGDPMLAFAADNACKPGGCTLLLSATPPQALQRDAVRGKLPHVKVPARFHGHPLPVPGQLAIPALKRVLGAGQLPPALQAKLRASLARGAQLFIFVPSIAMVEPLVHLLRNNLQGEYFPSQASVDANAQSPRVPQESAGPLVIEGTSSKDPLRTEKVQQFRSGAIRMLVTTTILERGVTVPKTDVFILDADTKLFDEAALVQMSGRAGRSKDDPAGNVYFAAKERTRSQHTAIAHIKSMNKIARKQDFLK